MINKQNLWFITLFSLILILGIYYINIDDEVAAVLKTEEVQKEEEVIEITESDLLVALEVENDTEKQALMEEYQNVLLDSESTLEEKNLAYENMQKLNDSKAIEEKIKNTIKEKFNLNSFVKIKDKTISITVSEKDHNKEKANSIIRCIQELFNEEMYITVKFNN